MISVHPHFNYVLRGTSILALVFNESWGSNLFNTPAGYTEDCKAPDQYLD